jgi:hypothetical protein
MTDQYKSLTELDNLLEALCEDRLSADEISRLEQLVLSSPEARWKYLTYLDLHGTLYWDAAGAGSPQPLSSEEIPIPLELAPSGTLQTRSLRNVVPKRRLSWVSVILATAACLMLGLFFSGRHSQTKPALVSEISAETSPTGTDNRKGDELNPGLAPTEASRPTAVRKHGPPVLVEATNGMIEGFVVSGSTVSGSTVSGSTVPGSTVPGSTVPGSTVPGSTVSQLIPLGPIEPQSANSLRSSQTIVALIDEEIQSRWSELGIEPSEQADDAEWMRRVYLDIAGRVPTIREAETFLGNRREQKRETLIDELLSDSGYVRNLTTKWTNLLIGRSPNSRVNREALEKFLRLSFAGNRPWNEIVSELISAEGSNVENGATNFLIAHLNNDATPATAVCSRLFLGRQVHCNQCHNNPFDDSKQVAFWELNSFFQQTTSVSRQRRDLVTGQVLGSFTELVTQDAGGPTYFETQSGLMRVAYPRFNNQDVDPGVETNRRRELARLMTAGEQPQLAAAFVNRMWEHFFGMGFTRSVDDMGPHSPASHPELLGGLSEQFIQSGYDIKQLVRWMCRSQAYQLSSRISKSNERDDPFQSDLPAFSRMSVRTMTAEQTYDSLLTATKAHLVGAVDWTEAEQNRQQWLQQFVVTFQTDENDESMAFEGSIGNALSLMNGPLIEKALETSAGSFLGEVVRQKGTEVEKIRLLCLATLSRSPSPAEITSMKKLLRPAVLSSRHGKDLLVESYQDLFWALLNSNEFASIH